METFQSLLSSQGSDVAPFLNTLMKERIWISCDCEIVFQPLHPDTGAPFHEERVMAAREGQNLHFEFLQRNVADGMRSSCKILSTWSQEFSGGDRSCSATRNTVQPVFGLGFQLVEIKDVDHDVDCHWCTVFPFFPDTLAAFFTAFFLSSRCTVHILPMTEAKKEGPRRSRQEPRWRSRS